MTDVVKFDHEPSEQEIFDVVLNEIYAQGQCKSGDSCLYRNIDRISRRVHRCAIGLFIPDDIYDSDMENTASGQVLLESYPNLPDFIHKNDELFFGLQEAHDDNSSRLGFVSHMKQIARKRNLTFIDPSS